ncbi:amidase domain-containing protein [Paenibacillus pinistramenti]|uniref:amidase domain-containing protein n=1 Tax=Paenibacillus pinistramenti TaxID=1768003 RepID=UPI001109320D|nr:amidase domain-containing protein [Paenibacillus pinistramenti]
MADEWKNVLSTYILQQNQDEVDYRPRGGQTVVTDLDYLLRRGERKLRMEKWYQERGASPLRSETKAKLVGDPVETPGEVEVELQLRRKIYYEKSGVKHREDRLDHQRLHLVRSGSDWLIETVTQLVPERNPVLAGAYPGSGLPGDTPHRLDRRGPYLNREVLGAGGIPRGPVYRREDAARYADEWWDAYNPEFTGFEVDCTNFISQCLFAGGAPINYTGKRESGWWYKGYIGGQEGWSYSWSVAGSLERYLSSSRSSLRAELVDRAEQLELGDVIIYDWDGDGAYQHSTIVTAFDAGGMPLVNAHTVSSRHRYWDYKDSYAWTESTRYRFFHIADRF